MELRLDRLLGRTVRDAQGRAVARIEEVHASRRGSGLVVTRYVLGAAGLVERLSLGPLVRALVGERLYRQAQRYTLDWDELDLGDPERPRLRGRLERLEHGRHRSRRRAG